MSKYLVKSTEMYRIDNEAEAKDFIDSQKKKYQINKHSTERKEKKLKGEVVDAWYRVTLVKDFNDEKEPDEPYFEEDDDYED